MKTINAKKAMEVLGNEKTPYTLKATLSHWLANYQKDVPMFIETLATLIEEV